MRHHQVHTVLVHFPLWVLIFSSWVSFLTGLKARYEACRVEMNRALAETFTPDSSLNVAREALAVRESNIPGAGLGLFATRTLQPGAVVCKHLENTWETFGKRL